MVLHVKPVCLLIPSEAKMNVVAHKVGCFSETKQPGDFFITEPNPHGGNARRLSFLCPCGCGDLCGIRIRDDGQQIDGAWASVS